MKKLTTKQQIERAVLAERRRCARVSAAYSAERLVLMNSTDSTRSEDAFRSQRVGAIHVHDRILLSPAELREKLKRSPGGKVGRK